MIQIPVFNSTVSDWEERVTLEDQEIIIRIQWNSRSEFWFADFDNQQGAKLLSRKLVPIFPISYSHRALFPIKGDFVLLPESDTSPEYPTFDGLGVTHNLYWLTPDELATWEATLGI